MRTPNDSRCGVARQRPKGQRAKGVRRPQGNGIHAECADDKSGAGAEPPDHRRHRPERRGRPGPRERVLPGEQPPAGGLAVRRRLPAYGEGRVPVPRRTVGQRQARLSVDVIALQELPCPCAAAMPPPEPPPQCLAAGRGRLPAHREPELHPVLRGIVVRRLAPRAVEAHREGRRERPARASAPRPVPGLRQPEPPIGRHQAALAERPKAVADLALKAARSRRTPVSCYCANRRTGYVCSNAWRAVSPITGIDNA